MKITSIRLGEMFVPLRVPFKTAVRTVEHIQDIIVEVHTDTGHVGYGEAPPTALVTGDMRGGIISAIRDCIAPVLIGQDIEHFDEVIALNQHSCIRNTSAKAAVDMALYDLFGQRVGAPTFQLLGGSRTSIETDITISVNDPEEMARDALAAKMRGYDCLKVKVGKEAVKDIARLQAIREAVGNDILIRIDANQGWKPKEAVRMLRQMDAEGLGIELCEQPVAARDIDGLAYVTARSPIPILADEAVFSVHDAMTVLQRRAADMINIKLMKCGGLSQALKIVQLAELYDVECMIGCMLEGAISVNAAVHLACAKQVITKIDLDGPVLGLTNPVQGGSQFYEKRIEVSRTPGLGIQGVEGLVYLEE